MYPAINLSIPVYRRTQPLSRSSGSRHLKQDCVCVLPSSGVEYLVAGHSDRKQGRLLVNMKSFVKPWKASLGRKVLTLLKKDCNW